MSESRTNEVDPAASGFSGWGRAATLSLALVLLFGAWLRTTDLGEAPFLGDELNHYYAAQSLAEGNGPRLPSGNEYLRGIEITELSRISLSVIDDPQTAARLPSALFGILGLVLIALIGKRFGGPWAAVWAMLLLAIYPEAVLQSRQTRFYTYQMCLGLVALFAGWRAVASEGDAPPRRQWAWAAVAIAAFGAALHVQVTTLSVLAGWLTAVALFAVRDLAQLGRAAWWKRPALALLSVGGAGLLGLVLVDPSSLQTFQSQAFYLPTWARRPGDARAYYWMISASLPVVLAFAPVSFFVVAIKRPWLAVYLAVWFAVPLAIHSFVLPWKAERYVFLAVPGLLLLTAVAVAAGASALSSAVRRSVQRGRPAARPQTASRAGWVSVALASAFAVGTSRPFHDSLNFPTAQPIRYWDEAFRIIQAEGLDAGPLGSSQGLAALHYWNRLDFVVGVDFLDPSVDVGDERSDRSLDWYAGRPVMTRPAAIQRHFPAAQEFAIALDGGRWEHGNVSPELRAALESAGEELCKGTCGDLLLFRWRPAGPGTQGSQSSLIPDEENDP